MDDALRVRVARRARDLACDPERLAERQLAAPPQPAQLMDEAEFHRHVGEENILPNVEAALRRAKEIRSVERPAVGPA